MRRGCIVQIKGCQLTTLAGSLCCPLDNAKQLSAVSVYIASSMAVVNVCEIAKHRQMCH